MSYLNMPTEFAAPRDCDHKWQPISMVFETQLLDPHGRVMVRQPDSDEARTYFICIGCASHTYMTTQFLGVRMYGSEDALDGQENYTGVTGINRDAWRYEEEE